MSSSLSASESSRLKRRKRQHTKSRGGCLRCKSRRIKCQETKPACANCMCKDLECVYRVLDGETLPSSAVGSVAQDASTPPSIPQALSLAQFTADDLQFFQHFLVAARPHLPFGNERQWRADIPAFAHHCPHLMHGILSLGATHYSLITPMGSRYFPSAIAHRGKALRYLNTALEKGRDATTLEIDGILATCYTLCFQAQHMDDGIVDFAVTVRGCGMVTDWILGDGRVSNVFHQIQTTEQVIALVTSWLPPGPFPVKDQATVEASLTNLALLEPLLQTPAQSNFLDALWRAYAALQTSPREAFSALTDIYSVWNKMENIEFLVFVAPRNYVCRALFLHYIAIDIFMQPLFLEINKHSRIMFASAHFIRYKWADTICQGLPLRLQRLVQGQADLIAADLEAVLKTGCRAPRWAPKLAFLEDWRSRRYMRECNLHQIHGG
ncbi:Zn(II)2Cys6 transcription factor [Aspergillus lucknowensis]|uniref:Zn(2)-C6 fungal-type domain-containing protein n=1 Tax=Aspergillus lucknowensis TaxID=176173 RepID=A0ABR4LIF2_9EURO